MHSYSRPLIILLFLLHLNAAGQEPGYGPDYQTAMIGNPGITGSRGDGYMRLSYMNHYPGNAYNLHTAFFSYDGYFPSLHGGAGLFISNDYLGGIVNDLKGGLSYAYFFRAGRDLYFSCGLSASFYHRGFSAGNAILPDQIDPLRGAVLPSGESLVYSGRTLFDLGTGFVFYTGKVSGGLAVNHLTEPDLSLNDVEGGKLRRRLFVHITGDFGPGNGNNPGIQPMGIFEVQKDHFRGGIGTAIAVSYLSAGLMLFADNGKHIDLQGGLSVSAGPAEMFYNYRFNLLSGQNLLPFSLQHHTGLALRLNNVDKRKTIKTINFPNL